MPRSTAPRRRPKELWIRVHLYLGLSAGLVFALVGLSGALSVYADEIDRWTSPGLYAPEPSPPGRGLAALAATHAPPGAAPAYLVVHAASPATAIFGFRHPDGRTVELHVARATGALLGARPAGQSVTEWLHAFHYGFFTEEAAPWIALATGTLLLVSVASGAYIWWPGKRRVLAALKVHRPGSSRRFHYELHRTLGALAALLLAASALTGIYQAFPGPFHAAAGPTDEELAAPPAAAHPLGLAAAVALASAAFPHADLRRADLLDSGEIRVILHDRRRPGWRGGETRLWFDSATGAMVRRRDPARQSPGTRVLGWLPAIHTGDIGGGAGRLAMFAAGLMPSVLLFTGLRLWWMRRAGGAAR